jgi:hypothetical protein
MERPDDMDTIAVSALNQMMAEEEGGDDDDIMTEAQYVQTDGAVPRVEIEDDDGDDPMEVDGVAEEEGEDDGPVELVPAKREEEEEEEGEGNTTGERPGLEQEEEGEDGEAEDEVKNLSSLLNEFEVNVVGSIDDLEESTREVENCRANVDKWLDKHMLEASVLFQGVPVEQRLALNDSETHLRVNVANLADAVAMNSAKIKLDYENLRLFVAGLVLQLSKGSQYAPFLVHRPLEDIDVGFSTDNPALPPNPSTDRLPYIETLRAPMFDDDSSSDDDGEEDDDSSDSSEMDDEDDEGEEGL